MAVSDAIASETIGNDEALAFNALRRGKRMTDDEEIDVTIVRHLVIRHCFELCHSGFVILLIRSRNE